MGSIAFDIARERRGKKMFLAGISNRLRKKREGQVLVETVMFLLILAVLFFGAVELGNGFLLTYKLSTAAREAVRLAAVTPNLEARAGNTAWLSLQKRIAETLVNINVDLIDVQWDIFWLDGSGNRTGGGNSEGEFERGRASLGNTIRVEVKAPLRLLSGSKFGWLENLTVKGAAVSKKLL